MPAKRDGTPIVDLAVLLASPALIMLMVGSLVWFLVDVLSPSSYPDRLLWCLSFFVFGAVLIARLAIENGYSYAAIYAAALGGATFLATIRFVEYPNARIEAVGWAINFGLMALVWWLANRLTWDCTHLDEDQKTSGRGLLAAAGLDDTAPTTPDDDAESPDDAAKPRKKDPAGLMGWFQRIERYREARRKRPHTPGTWVLYVGLAALPVFALGQSLVPAADAAKRRATLTEAAVFVGSALGLLVVTSLMGLRRYLEQRDARVPLPMTAGWLGLGAGLIVVFLAAAAILPRPHSETPLFDVSRAVKGVGELAASRNAVVKDGSAGKGEGAAGTKGEPGSDGRAGKDGKRPGQEPGEGRGQSASGGSGSGKSGEPKSGGSQAGEKKADGGKEAGSKGQGGGEPKADGGAKSQDKSDDGEKGPGGREEPTEGGEKPDADSKPGPSPDAGPSATRQQLGQALDMIGSLLKWVVWAVIALAVLAGLVFFVLKGLAPFTNWAKNLLDWFRNLFGKRAAGLDPIEGDEDGGDEPRRSPRPSFADFRNPFGDGSARRRTPADLATYTLAALDGWAWDRDAGRRPGETPAEFAARLGAEFPGVDATRAAELAVRALYSNAPLPADAPKVLAALWKRMEAEP